MSDDLISRQAAIEALLTAAHINLSDGQAYFLEKALNEIPSAQPEIIRCKDCKFAINADTDMMCGNPKSWVVATENDFGKKERTMIDLKPCPFCGGEARLVLNAKRKIYKKDEYRTGVVACCNVCEARMFYGSEKLAIEAWNRRAGEQDE